MRWRRSLLGGVAIAAMVGQRVAAQARAPLAVTVDSTGALSAIRVIDLRQLCHCPTVALDSVVRRGTRLSMFNVLTERPALILTGADVSRLALARHRIVRTALRNMTSPARDTVAVAVQLLPATGADRRVLVVATPPNGVTVAWLITLTPHRAAWRATSIRSVYEP